MIRQWIFDRELVSHYYRYFTVNLMCMRKLRSLDLVILSEIESIGLTVIHVLYSRPPLIHVYFSS